VVVASACYVATWQVIFFKFAPNFMTSYQAHILEEMRTDGESEQAIAKKRVELAEYAELYRNPAINAAITFLEPLPVGLVMALVSAGVLSRGRSSNIRNGAMVGVRT
jgi:hypothetical protein